MDRMDGRVNTCYPSLMAKGTLVGVRFQKDDLEVIDKLCVEFSSRTPGVKFTRPMAVRAACLAMADSVLDPNNSLFKNKKQAKPKPKRRRS